MYNWLNKVGFLLNISEVSHFAKIGVSLAVLFILKLVLKIFKL